MAPYLPKMSYISSDEILNGRFLSGQTVTKEKREGGGGGQYSQAR